MFFFLLHWFSLHPKETDSSVKSVHRQKLDSLNVCIHVATQLRPLSPSSAVYQWLFQLPPQRKGLSVVWESASLPPSFLLNGERGAINKGNSISSSTVTQADTLKTSMSTHASAHTHTLKAHRESMESPSAITYNDFLPLCVCVRGVASCSNKLFYISPFSTAFLLP